MEMLKKSFNQILGSGKIESLIKKIAFIYWCIGMIFAALSAIGIILLSLTFFKHGLVSQFIRYLILGVIPVGMIIITTILVCLALCASSEVLKLLTEIRNSVTNAEGDKAEGDKAEGDKAAGGKAASGKAAGQRDKEIEGIKLYSQERKHLKALLLLVEILDKETYKALDNSKVVVEYITNVAKEGLRYKSLNNIDKAYNAVLKLKEDYKIEIPEINEYLNSKLSYDRTNSELLKWSKREDIDKLDEIDRAQFEKLIDEANKISFYKNTSEILSMFNN